MTSANTGPVPQLLRWLARTAASRPWLFFYPQLVLFGLAVFYTVRYLEFSTDRSILVSEDQRDHHNFIAYRADFRTQDELVALVESDDLEKSSMYGESTVSLRASRLVSTMRPGEFDALR